MELIVCTPEPPYYAVIFSSLLTEAIDGYEEMALKMMELAEQQAGFIGVEPVRENLFFGITVSYWKNKESITKWQQNIEHQLAQQLGKEQWYKSYKVRVSKVERAYGFER